MLAAILCSAALMSGPDAPDVRRDYEEARSRAGRSADEQVRLALWCESRGLDAERLKHLALAVLTDPAHATARGLMGLVAYRGRWQRPQAVSDKVQADPSLAAALREYDERRSKEAYSADAQWRLAQWCEAKGLIEQSRAHLTAVIRLDPSREPAWRKLGYRKFEGRWRTDEQVARQKADSEAQDRADRTWGTQLARWRSWLEDDAKRPEAEAGLDGVDDPRAVPSVIRVFGSGGPGDQAMAVRLLGQIDAIASSRALAILAVRGKSPEVRRISTEILARCDPREFVGFLIGGLRRPMSYQLGVRQWADGTPHLSLWLEGEKANYQVDSILVHANPTLPRLFADSVPFDPYGGQAKQMWADAWDSLDATSVQALVGLSKVPGAGVGHLRALGHNQVNHPLASDYANSLVYEATIVASQRDAQIGFIQGLPPRVDGDFRRFAEAWTGSIDAHNADAIPTNEAIYAILTRVTGKDLPKDPEPWKKWWLDSVGYALKSSREATGEQPRPTFQLVLGSVLSSSCFAAGTTVRTLAGDRPIESIRIGDQVLAQDTATGSLSYRSITQVLHNPPAATLRVTMGDESIVATGLHRFWKAGKGWAMARDLNVGDTLRALEGPVRVSAIADDHLQPVFNLEVEGDADFFVGRLGALVHDHSLPGPRLAPFDATPSLAAKGR